MKPYMIAMLCVLLLVAAQLGWYVPRLPDHMAANFDFNGTPNGYESKAAFLGWYAVSLLFIAVLFMTLPFLMRKLPTRFINLPHATYWLSPERRDHTLAELVEAVGWFGAWTLLFLAWTFHLSILANLADPVRMSSAPFWAGFVIYMAYAVWWATRLIRRFGRVSGG